MSSNCRIYNLAVQGEPWEDMLLLGAVLLLLRLSHIVAMWRMCEFAARFTPCLFRLEQWRVESPRVFSSSYEERVSVEL
jgi:hypothetical protein